MIRVDKSYRDTLDELMQDPSFKAEYDALEFETQMERMLIQMQIQQESELSDEDAPSLAEMQQADLENGEDWLTDPRISTLSRIAKASGMSIALEIVPTQDEPRYHIKWGAPVRDAALV